MNDLLLIPTRVPTRYGEFLLYRVALLAFKERTLEKVLDMVFRRSRMGIEPKNDNAVSARLCNAGRCEFVRRCPCIDHGIVRVPSPV